VKRAAIAQCHGSSGDRGHGLAEMKGDAMRLVHALHESPDLCAHDVLERPFGALDNIDRKTTGPKRRRDLEPNETAADHDDMLRGRRALYDRATVGKAAQKEDLLAVRPRDGQSHRLCAGGN